MKTTETAIMKTIIKNIAMYKKKTKQKFTSCK